MGAFSAVSNVTGIIADVDAIAILLHKYGALAFFDYASGAPYVKMNMNPNPVGYSSMGKSDEGGVVAVDPSKDAIYFSPHKCYGGTSTPGVLVIKKHVSDLTIQILVNEFYPPMLIMIMCTLSFIDLSCSLYPKLTHQPFPEAEQSST
jgi:cysteine sulfinate desulfinase/cysteine desulfurase-like protein